MRIEQKTELILERVPRLENRNSFPTGSKGQEEDGIRKTARKRLLSCI
nr:MAG TPA: hypothetical protein [Caudoviricetes sp.]